MSCKILSKPSGRAFERNLRFWFASSLISVAVVQSSRLCHSADRPSVRAAHGFAYQHDEVRDKPWSIHIVKVDRTSSDVELHTTLGNGAGFGLATLSQQARSVPPSVGRAVAAINGDYFYDDRPYIGDPKGLQILRGELVSGPCDWTCFWIDSSGAPHMTNVMSRFEVKWPNGQRTPMGLNQERASDAAVLYSAAVGPSTRTRGGREFVLERNGTNTWLPLRAGQTYQAQVRQVRDAGDTPLNKDVVVLSLGRQAMAKAPKLATGAVLQVSTATWPSLEGVKTAIGGGPPIVRAGKIIDRIDPNVRHPRSAIGWNKDHIFLVEVDGRQRNLSVGMTNPELANYMIKIGCDEAMCFDGGGSATCWVYGQVMNSPSEGKERAMANALVLVQKENK